MRTKVETKTKTFHRQFDLNRDMKHMQRRGWTVVGSVSTSKSFLRARRYTVTYQKEK